MRAVLLEEQRLPDWARADRALVLWVLAPSDKLLQGRTLLDETDSTPEAEYDYTCPEQSHGHFYRAPTRVSLVDMGTKSVINTVRVMLTSKDEYDIPFSIRPGYLYKVPGPLHDGTGKPHILRLRDLNGDGKPLEFCLFVMESCTGPDTMVLGYSQRQDRVVVYSFHLAGRLWDKENPVTTWMDRFVMQKPISVMHWSYDFWYNSGKHVAFDFRYIPKRERFEGIVRTGDSATDLLNKR